MLGVFHSERQYNVVSEIVKVLKNIYFMVVKVKVNITNRFT